MLERGEKKQKASILNISLKDPRGQRIEVRAERQTRKHFTQGGDVPISKGRGEVLSRRERVLDHALADLHRTIRA